MSPFRAATTLAVAIAALSGVRDACAQPRSDDERQNLKMPAAVAQADWSQVREILVELADHHFDPNELTLKVGVPYLLRLKNVGGISHDMVGGSFFSKEVIALRMVNSRVGRVTADDISSVYVRPKNDTELWFVPIRKGVFSFVCSIPGHQESGMEGTIRVVD